MIKLLLLLAAVCSNLKHWLYRLGNEYASLTGGWQARAWTGNGSIWTAKAPGLTKNAGSMTVSMTDKYSSGKSGVVEILNNVDLTPYATLRVKLNLAIGGCGAEDTSESIWSVPRIVPRPTTGRAARSTKRFRRYSRTRRPARIRPRTPNSRWTSAASIRRSTRSLGWRGYSRRRIRRLRYWRWN